MSYISKQKFKFFAGDLHFRHANIVVKDDPRFPHPRPYRFVEEHDEALIENWNRDVKPDDKCLITGDFAFNNGAQLLARLNGKKYGLFGNHDIKHIMYYAPYFLDLKAYYEDKGQETIFSHIPIHPCQLDRWKINVHSHTHAYNVPDDRYINISMEQINYRPIHVDQLNEIIRQRKERVYGLACIGEDADRPRESTPSICGAASATL